MHPLDSTIHESTSQRASRVRPITSRAFNDETTAGHIREDGAIREHRVMDPERIRVRLQTRWQASWRLDGETVVMEHAVRGSGMGDGGWGMGKVGALTGN